MNNRTITRAAGTLLLLNGLSLAIAGQVHAQAAPETGAETQLMHLQQQIDSQAARLEALQRQLAEQQRSIVGLREALNAQRLAAARARGAQSEGPPDEVPPPVEAPVVAEAAPAGQAASGQPTPETVGRAPTQAVRPPDIARIFEQPGVLTPQGQFVLEPSLQFGYSSSNRVALVGYTVIPAILIGLIDVRQVKTTTAIATLTGRYGLTNRLELEGKVPYVYASSDTVSREIFTGSSVENVFNAHGEGLGDVELTARYQFNRTGPNSPFFIGWLRYKSRTGTDAFEVTTDCVTRCVANTTGTGLPLELPTGSGFEAIQPGLTWLYVSDPVVFFGSFSYLHNFPRDNASRTVLNGAGGTTTEFIGDIEAGDIYGFNVGVGLALNEKAAISIGYDQNFVGKTQQNGDDAPGAVKVVLGTLMLGASYRFSETNTLNVALGIGVTRDTPDVTLTARMPISF